MKINNSLIVSALLLGNLAMINVVQAATYQTDPGHTFVRYSYNHFGFSNQMSRFDKVDGTVILDQQTEKGSVDITIDMTSISSGSAKLNEHIQDEDFFNTAKYPTAHFVSHDFIFKGNALGEIKGELTIKNITKPVTLHVTSFKCALHPIIKKDACGANATTTVKRSEFGMSKYVPFVSDDVTIDISIEALKQ